MGLQKFRFAAYWKRALLKIIKKRRNRRAVTFSELPEDIIELIAERLTCIDDFVRAAATCKSWQSGFAAVRKRHHFTPWLIHSNNTKNLRTFYCLSSKRKFTFELAQLRYGKFWGTPFGWMVNFGVGVRIDLVNPVSGVKLSLPYQSIFTRQNIDEVHNAEMLHRFPVRFVLSSNPSLSLTPDPNTTQNQSCVVIAIFYPKRQPCFAKPGDRAWTPIETTLLDYDDVIYFNGLVYAVDHDNGFLMVCDITAPHPKGTLIESPPPYDLTRSRKVYLIDISGELHVVVCYLKLMGYYYRVTNDFHVYKFEFRTNSWTGVDDLGDHAVFVGNNSSFVISTRGCPDFKRNAIYYTGDDPADMAVYDFTEGTFDHIYMGPNFAMFSGTLFIIPGL